MNIERKSQFDKRDKETEEVSPKEEKKAELISRFIENRVLENKSLDADEEENLAKRYENRSDEEKAVELYQKMIVYMQAMRTRKEALDRGGESQDGHSISPKLISRIKILFNDPGVRHLIPSTYGRARMEQQDFRAGDLTQEWEVLTGAIQEKESEYRELSKKLFQGHITYPDDLEESKHELLELEDDLAEDEQAQDAIEGLEGYIESPENTDSVALIQFEKLKKYAKQNQEEGYVWLPSREAIVREVMKFIESGDLEQTRKGVFFISESGSGKSSLIRAIAYRLTGTDRVKITSGPRIGDTELIGREKIFAGAEEIEQGTYVDYQDTVTSAWTGYDYSYQKRPMRETSIVVELDEMPTAFANTTFFSRLKGFFTLRDGDRMPGTDKKVLPGRLILASGNVGAHHNHPPMPEALKREFRVISVDYPEMSVENPELYEFILSTLLRENSLPALDEREIKPGYRREEFGGDDKIPLSDGSVAVARDVLIKDSTSMEHGYLYRLSYAIKAVQDAYMARGGENEFIDYTKRNSLRFKESDSGDLYIEEGGKILTLSTTVTLGDLGGWMRGYLGESRKKNPKSISEWIDAKLKEVIGEKETDKAKLEAIFNHFNLLNVNESREGSSDRVFTPKEIGYLSPRVPRALHIEKSNKGEGVLSDTEKKRELRERKTAVVVLEDGSEISIRVEDYSYNNSGQEIVVSLGEKIDIGDQEFIFAGIVDDKESDYNSMPIVKMASEDLYRSIKSEQLEDGILAHESKYVLEEIDGQIVDMSESFWDVECKDNPENNPERISLK